MAILWTFIVANRKWLAYAAAGLAILFCIRWYGNAQWSKGVDYGDQRTTIKMTEEFKRQWADAQKQLDAQKKLLDEGVKRNEADRRVLYAREAELARSRQAIVVALARAMAVAEAGKAAGYQSAISLTDLTIDTAIRRLSADLERERTAAGTADPK